MDCAGEGRNAPAADPARAAGRVVREVDRFLVRKVAAGQGVVAVREVDRVREVGVREAAAGQAESVFARMGFFITVFAISVLAGLLPVMASLSLAVVVLPRSR